jgi:acid phosphatase family membrane protein YuiD
MNMFFSSLLNNPSLMTAIIAWFLAQILKPPVEYLRKGKWNWGYLLSAGGMPSSHSALMVGATFGIGLHEGFNNPVFTIAVAITMIVVYDAMGVRREAGRHAEMINILINELLSGHPISDKELREVLGHTPLEVIGGIILGIIVSIVYWAMVV